MGAEAEASYRQMVQDTQAATASGRTSFDGARAAWAGPLSLEPNDGLYLGELRGEPRTLAQLTEALEPCGTTRREVIAAVDRLTDLGMIEPT